MRLIKRTLDQIDSPISETNALLTQHTPVICIEEQEHIRLDEVWPHFEAGLKQLMTTEFSLEGTG